MHFKLKNLSNGKKNQQIQFEFKLGTEVIFNGIAIVLEIENYTL